MVKTELIKDGQELRAARYTSSGTEVSTYDDGFGQLWIHRDSMGVSGIVRAQTWEDAYGICEDEFFPEADETIDELVKEYGFRVESKKVIHSEVSIPKAERPPRLGEHEKFAVYPDDYTDNGKLPEYSFIRWETISTPDHDAWSEHPCFQEGFGFRPNGPNQTDKLNHGIYSKDLNGDSLDRLTPELVEEIGITVEIKATA